MFVRLILLLAIAVPAAGCASESTDRTEADRTEAISEAGSLTRVEDLSQVCMVNNQFMGKAQIPVEIAGKTYYGCCAMCKGRLESDVTARTATDPVTGATVDKATAVVGRDATGAVHYFANATNLARYRSSP